MIKSMIIATALVTAWGGGAQALVQTVDGDSQLQISRLTGGIEVETPSRQESEPGQNLPYIRSGSIVRVRSGSVEMRSPTGATVRAGKGDAFQFVMLLAEAGRPQGMRIAAVESEPKALEVAVGGQRFDIEDGGGLTVLQTGRREVTVRAEWNGVKLAPGSLAADGSRRESTYVMASGESIILPVSEASVKQKQAMSLSGVSVTRKNDTTYEATGSGKSAGGGLVSAEKTRGTVTAWPDDSRTAAEAILERYGSPDDLDSDHVSWNDNGPWLRTTVHRVPTAGGDVLEQFIRYEVPQEKLAELAKADIGLTVDSAAQTISATSESEGTNFLALNLADEVVREKKTAEEAREFYLRTVKLSAAGKESPYMRELHIRP